MSERSLKPPNFDEIIINDEEESISKTKVPFDTITHFPEKGFHLKVHVYYSKTFADWFGPDPLIK